MPSSIHDSHDAYVAEARDDIEHLATSQDLIDLFESGGIHEAADEWARGHNHYVYRHLHREFFTKVGDWDGLSEAYHRACENVTRARFPHLDTDSIIRVTLAEMVVEYLAYVYTDAMWHILYAREINGDEVAKQYLTDLAAVAASSVRDVPHFD